MKIVLSLLLLSALGSRGAEQSSQLPLDHFFDSHGVRIRFVEQGDGPAVVLIHGYIGNADRHWISTGVLPSLARDYHVIALDCRGHGKSGKPHDATAYGAEMGRDVVRLLDHLKIQQAHLVGYSMGAFIAGHVLVADTNRFLSATFIGHHPVRGWTDADEQEAEATARDLESDTPFRSLILSAPRNGPPPDEGEIQRLSQTLVAANDPKALAAYHRGRRTLAVKDADLAAIRVPILEIVGSADPVLPGMRELRAVMPSASLVVIQGAEHGGERGVLRHPEFLVSLREFLAARTR